MTIHASKGREFNHVIVAHADVGPEYESDEEERRLFYVAITRAMNRVDAVCSRQRYIEWKGMQNRTPVCYLAEANFLIFQNATGTPTSDRSA